MKTAILIILGFLLISGGLLLVSALGEEENSDEPSSSVSSCNGRCSSQGQCGNPSCGAKLTGSCGCRG